MSRLASPAATRRAAFVGALLLAACQANPGTGTSAPSATMAASPDPAPASLASWAATPGPTTPVTTSATPGSWAVTLTGPRDGAGSYTGNAFIICAAPTIDGRLYWTATMINPAGPITDISLQQNSSGFDTVQVTGPGGMETGSWFARSDTPGQTAQVRGSGGVSGALVTGDGTFTDSTNSVYTIHATLDCSDTSM